MELCQPMPDGGTCDVWWARATDDTPALFEVLSAEERTRAQSFRLPADRRRAVVSYGLLRLVLAAYLHENPAALPLFRTCPTCGQLHGRPRLAIPGPVPIQYNVSHSGDRVVVAIAKEAPVGVDVEVMRSNLSVTELAHLTLSPPERETLAQLPSEEQLRGFFTYWTRKEAVVKAIGYGLAVRLQNLIVSGPMEPPRLLFWAEDPSFANQVTLNDVDLGPGYAACVAVVGACRRVTVKAAAPLLATCSDLR